MNESATTEGPPSPKPRPRVRLSVRALLAFVAVCALPMLAYVEFKDGAPPRFIIRAMPGRIARLRPGMTHAQAVGILGLDRPWYRGGALGYSGRRPPGAITTSFQLGKNPGGVADEYTLGRVRLGARVAESGPESSSFHVIAASVHLNFCGVHPPPVDGPNKSDRLVSASFTDIEGRKTVMPGSR